MHDLDRRLAAARLELGGEAPPRGRRRVLARLAMLARALRRNSLAGATGHA
ncbi:MAG: hypothetical protein U1E53_14785 [Dongiaceae bacterium]